MSEFGHDAETAKALFRQSIEKRCAIEVEKVRKSQNMVEAENVIYYARLRYFGLDNIGLLKAQMRQDNKLSEFEEIKAERERQYAKMEKPFVEFMVGHIPERMRQSAMYLRLTERLAELPEHDFTPNR